MKGKISLANGAGEGDRTLDPDLGKKLGYNPNNGLDYNDCRKRTSFSMLYLQFWFTEPKPPNICDDYRYRLPNYDSVKALIHQIYFILCDVLSVDAKAAMPSDGVMPESLLPLGEAIRNQRESLGLSQEKLAERCGFDRTYISMLERGKRNPSFLNLLRLATGLKISVSTLTAVYNGTRSNR